MLKRIRTLKATDSHHFSFKFLSTQTLETSPNPNSPLNLKHTHINPLTKTQLKTLVLNQYASGKFTNLIHNVIALPSLLLTACQNLTPPHSNAGSLLDSVSKRFSITEMGAELGENRFDFEACCITMSRLRGESLVLPNLKLKVVVEAIRMVLEVVYDDRFATFAYGGRVGMGRHTAIRYLKNTVEDPSWWFTVAFNRQKFDDEHVCKLCIILEEKIKDDIFIDIVKRLFKFEVAQIELNGCYLGRGFPQESGLSSILINVYFNGLDKQIHEMRLKIDRENPRFDSNELIPGLNIFQKPRRVYAVRYLDEILVITSGSKVFTIDLKNKVTNFIESRLDLKVDKLRTAIHSAVSEKIDFLGMELRAVAPSILHPPMSEKAIRARKKYVRQKEVRLMELRNARETNRKKLGMKILSNVFKKLKRSDGFKFDFHIENEVRDIFKTWSDEAAHEFFASIDERQELHRLLSGGVFLSLGRIRDQLPPELINAYDKFQEQVDKHLNPMNAKKAQEEEESRKEEEEEKKYADRTVEDLTKLSMKVAAPIELVRKAVKLVGFTNHMGRPRPISLLHALEDTDIIKWYAGIGKRWLDYFCCCHNIDMIKTIVTYHLRYSCILTLAEKHESTKREVIKHFTKDLKVSDLRESEELYFPTEREIKMLGDKNLSDPKPVDGAISMALIRLASDEPPCYCVAHFCVRTDTIFYRLRLLQNRLNISPLDEKQWISGMGAIHECLDKKCIPLCSDHIHGLYMGTLTLQDVDCTALIDVD